MKITQPEQQNLHSDPFKNFYPVLWQPEKESGHIYSIKRNHGIKGSYKLHNLNDAINDDKPTHEKIIVNYTIGDFSYPLFTASDLINSTFEYNEACEGNILGEIAERISRRSVKYFLKHLHKSGKTGGIFDSRFDPQKRDDFIITHTDDFVLKILKYPNLIILKKTGKGKYGYENIKELDGFFDYRFMKNRHIIVLESKLDKINICKEDLVTNLFQPLKALFPDATFHYILFSDRHSIFVRNNYEKRRQLKPLPFQIYEILLKENVGSLFFTFNETREDFEKIKNFLALQYRALRKLSLTMFGKTIVSEKELIIFDGGETPHIKLIKDLSSGLWKEVPLRHKRS
jgi:hypothetical protein